MSGSALKEKIKSGKPVFGTFIHYVTQPRLAELLPLDALDFVVLNTEHNAYGLSDFLPLSLALKGSGVACLVRVTGHSTDEISKACDAFPDGVVIPYVEDVEKTRRLVAAANRRPLKGASLERALTEDVWPSAKSKAYLDKRNANVAVCLMIESVRALENLDALCAIPGVNAVFAGPNDLSISLGIPDEYEHPEYLAALQKIVDAANRHGLAGGSHFSSMRHARYWLERGARFIPYHNDGKFLKSAAEQAFGELAGRGGRAPDQVV
ncbi:MAG: aldolase/citrate lyase family protein [Planctomycetota bacterium]|nr:aldolase/citrate lyase family protein [Planctomycetota bacterium]